MAYQRRRAYPRRTTRTTRKARLVRRVRVNAQYRRARKQLTRYRASRQRVQARYARFYTNEQHSYSGTIPFTTDVYAYADLSKPVIGRSNASVVMMAQKYSQFRVNLVVIKITTTARQTIQFNVPNAQFNTLPHRCAGIVLPNAAARNNADPSPNFQDLMNMPGVKVSRYGSTLKLFMKPKHYIYTGLQNTSQGSNTLQLPSGWQDTAMLLQAPPGGADYIGTYFYTFDQHAVEPETLLIEKYFYCSFKGERSAMFVSP